MAKRMPNQLRRDQNAEALLREAEAMRAEEMRSREDLCSRFGFSESHLDLLRQFYLGREDASFQWFDPTTTTWNKELSFWQATIEGFRTRQKDGSLVQWIKGFRAECTNASDQRYLKTRPSEKMEFEIVYTHRETTSTCIIQLQIAIDFFHPVANISQICCSKECDRRIGFSLSAPSEPGLYMLWAKGCYHYSFRQAEDEYPKNYDRCEDWYKSFIAWYISPLRPISF
jgi:hypothetical protein